MRVDHIGIAVEDLAAAKKLYGEVLGLKLLFEEEVPTEKVRVAAYDGGGMRIELLESTSPDGPIGRHVAAAGPASTTSVTRWTTCRAPWTASRRRASG